MSELGLFPLDLVLLPTERVPLHVFEPRYKELVGECLAESREFGIVLADEDGLRDVGTSAEIVEVTRVFDDGRLDIVVQGRARFRIAQLTEGRSFQTAEVETVEDGDDEPRAEAEVERVLGLFGQVVEVAEAEVDRPDEESPLLSFELAGRIDFSSDLKQELLELRSESARLRRLGELLDRALDALKLEREVRERASGNGRVSPR